jgi:hypothetical protein
MAQVRKCKITVIRKECYTDLQEQYLADPKSGPCSIFELGRNSFLSGAISAMISGI